MTMRSISKQKRTYWQFQYRLTQEYILPLLQKWGIQVQGRTVLEVGCAEAGVLAAFVDAGAKGRGVDINLSRVELARKLAAEHGVYIQVNVGDFLDPKVITQLGGPYDLIILRDVLEHLPNKSKALTHIRKLMGDNGWCFLSFPPYWSPFGGHQQMLSSFFRFLPYFHWWPYPIFSLVTRVINRIDRNTMTLNEISFLRRERLSLHQFERLARALGFQIVRHKFYLLRPSFKLRYGWPVLEARLIGMLPGLREIAVTGAFYLLKPM